MGLFFPEVAIDNADRGRIADQFEATADIEFAHDAGAVLFDGLGHPDDWPGLSFIKAVYPSIATIRKAFLAP